ncbi:MAG: signal recognition particle receptor subunit alpha [Candidatus Diapherotrites archaeon]
MTLGENLRKAIESLKKMTVMDRAAIKEVVKELQRALIASDVEVSLVLELSKKIEDAATVELPKGLTRREHVIKTTYDLLAGLLGRKTKIPEDPKRILLVGLFGSGKTTTTAKLAKYYMKRGKKVGVIAGDTYRPAAFEQLQQLSKKSDIHFYGNKKETNAPQVVEEGLKEFKGYDLVITDSAGRSALDNDLVKELKEIHKAFKPDETWLVLSADIGQVAKKQANAFHDAVGVNGVIITKIDGSSKGGGALAACNETKAGVLFLGTGEKINDLEEFDAERYLSRIMGYGDLQALLEKVKDLEEDDTLSPEEIFEGNFNMRVFYHQLKAAGKIGTMDKIAEMIGLKMEMPAEQLQIGEDKLKGFKVIMDSMTAEELEEPDLLNNSRIKRVARGSGKTDADVRELIKQYKQMKNVFKKMKKFSDPKKLEKMQKTGDFGKMFSGMGKKKKKKFRFR